MPRPIQRKSSSVFLLNYHVVWIPKYRRKVLVGAVRERLIKLLSEKCKELGWEVIALEVMPDHLHLFVGVNPSVAPEDIPFRLKGYTSRTLRREFPHLKRMPTMWTPSYFVSSAGNVSAATIERYIAEQTTKG